MGTDLEQALEPKSTSTVIQTVLVNDRHRWSWHQSTVRNAFAKTFDGPNPKLADPDEFVATSIVNFLDDRSNINRTFDDEQFRDPVVGKYLQPGLPHEEHSYFARGERLLPYRYSFDESLRQKSWVFLAEVERDRALAKVNEIRHTLCWWGTAVFAIVTTVVAGLWYWLIRLLRRA